VSASASPFGVLETFAPRCRSASLALDVVGDEEIPFGIGEIIDRSGRLVVGL
jgi:hypothetical protein